MYLPRIFVILLATIFLNANLLKVLASPVENSIESPDSWRDLLDNRVAMQNIYEHLDKDSRRNVALSSVAVRDRVVEAAFGYLPDTRTLTSVKAKCGHDILGKVFLSSQPLPSSVDLICAEVILISCAAGHLPFLTHLAITKNEELSKEGRYIDKFSHRFQAALKSEKCYLESIEIDSELPNRYLEAIFNSLNMYPEKVIAMEIQETSLGKKALKKFSEYLLNSQMQLVDLKLDQVRLPASEDSVEDFFIAIRNSKLRTLQLDLRSFSRNGKFNINVAELFGSSLTSLSLNSVVASLAGTEIRELGRLIASNEILADLYIDCKQPITQSQPSTPSSTQPDRFAAEWKQLQTHLGEGLADGFSNRNVPSLKYFGTHGCNEWSSVFESLASSSNGLENLIITHVDGKDIATSRAIATLLATSPKLTEFSLAANGNPFIHSIFFQPILDAPILSSELLFYKLTAGSNADHVAESEYGLDLKKFEASLLRKKIQLVKLVLKNTHILGSELERFLSAIRKTGDVSNLELLHLEGTSVCDRIVPQVSKLLKIAPIKFLDIHGQYHLTVNGVNRLLNSILSLRFSKARRMAQKPPALYNLQKLHLISQTVGDTFNDRESARTLEKVKKIIETPGNNLQSIAISAGTHPRYSHEEGSDLHDIAYEKSLFTRSALHDLLKNGLSSQFNNVKNLFVGPIMIDHFTWSSLIAGGNSENFRLNSLTIFGDMIDADYIDMHEHMFGLKLRNGILNVKFKSQTPAEAIDWHRLLPASHFINFD